MFQVDTLSFDPSLTAKLSIRNVLVSLICNRFKSSSRMEDPKQEPIVLERPATFCKRNGQEEFGDEGDEILRWWKRKLPEMENKFGG